MTGLTTLRRVISIMLQDAGIVIYKCGCKRMECDASIRTYSIKIEISYSSL